MMYLNEFIKDRRSAEEEGKPLTSNEKIVIEKGHFASGIVFFQGTDTELYPVPNGAKKLSDTLYSFDYVEDFQTKRDFWLFDKREKMLVDLDEYIQKHRKDVE